jgi:hypothetical protein
MEATARNRRANDGGNKAPKPVKIEKTMKPRLTSLQCRKDRMEDPALPRIIGRSRNMAPDQGRRDGELHALQKQIMDQTEILKFTPGESGGPERRIPGGNPRN